MKNNPIYSAKQVAEMFQVTRNCMWYWHKEGKLIPFKHKQKQNEYEILYRQSDIVDFIKRKHNGDYAPSPIDVFYALDYMGIKDVIELPEHYTQKYTHTQPHEIDNPNNNHVVNNMAEYFKKISQIKFKPKTI
jgi:hypothetical protein